MPCGIETMKEKGIISPRETKEEKENARRSDAINYNRLLRKAKIKGYSGRNRKDVKNGSCRDGLFGMTIGVAMVCGEQKPSTVRPTRIRERLSVSRASSKERTLTGAGEPPNHS